MLSLVGAGAAGSMLQRRGSMNIGCGGYWKGVEGAFWIGGPRARKRAPERWEQKGGKATVGNYSTVKSALRLSATLSIRPSGRVQSIDMFWGSILVSKDITSGLSELASFVQQESVKRLKCFRTPQ
jgi:hypothetical protein